jgi:peptidoglycan/LPS O-acetylase OafA/YrhL
MRFTALDSWRGIAALGVAASHSEVMSSVYDTPLILQSYLFVDFFFVLSGFVIAHAYVGKIQSGLDLASFIIRRFGRLWPLHAAVLVAFIAIEGAKFVATKSMGLSSGSPAFDPAAGMGLAALPGHFALLTALGLDGGLSWNRPDWSISAEFWTYVVFGITALSATSWRLVAIAATGILAALVLVTHAKTGMDATYDLGLMRCLAGFMLGQLVYHLRLHLDLSGLRYPFALETVVVAMTMVFMTVAGRGQLSFLAPLIFACVVFVFSYEQGPVSRLLKKPGFQAVGDWSYSIYMVHALVWYVGAMAISIWARRNGTDPWQIVDQSGYVSRALVFETKAAGNLLLLVYLGVVVTLSALTKRLIEDPGRRYFARIADRLDATPQAEPGSAPKPLV